MAYRRSQAPPCQEKQSWYNPLRVESVSHRLRQPSRQDDNKRGRNECRRHERGCSERKMADDAFDTICKTDPSEKALVLGAGPAHRIRASPDSFQVLRFYPTKNSPHTIIFRERGRVGPGERPEFDLFLFNSGASQDIHSALREREFGEAISIAEWTATAFRSRHTTKQGPARTHFLQSTACSQK